MQPIKIGIDHMSLADLRTKKSKQTDFRRKSQMLAAVHRDLDKNKPRAAAQKFWGFALCVCVFVCLFFVFLFLRLCVSVSLSAFTMSLC